MVAVPEAVVARFAYVDGGTVLSIVEAAQAADFPDLAPKLVACGDEVRPNWKYDGAAFSDPDVSPANRTLALRAEAERLFSDPVPVGKVLRAVVLVLRDEINILRSAASLAPRTVNQVRNAILAKISDGSADNGA